MSARILGIGLDGATFDLLDPWFAAGKLPTLRALCDRGVRAPLESVLPALSPQAWTSFMTGKNPGKHGVWDFLVHEPHSYDIQFTNAAQRRAASLWRLLSDAGRRVCVMNVPMTFPPEPVNGYLLSGMEAPGVYADFAYPPALYPRLKKELGGYNMHGDYWITGSADEYLDRVHATIADQARALRFLLADDAWDLCFMVFGSTDRVQHHFWAQMDPRHPHHDPHAPARHRSAIYEVYARIDEEIARAMEHLAPDATVFVMSDHGAGPYESIVYLDRWLAARGYLAYRATRHDRSPHALLMRATEETYVALRRRLPRSLKDWLKSTLPTVRRGVESYLLTSAIDWSRTRAFSLGIESTRIYVNTAGRFPQGAVQPGAEYETVVAAIARDLAELRDPLTGDRVVERVYRPRELYDGPLVHEAADLIVTWAGDRYITRKAYGPDDPGTAPEFVGRDLSVGEVGRLMSIPQTGTHRRTGIFMAAGPPFPAGLRLASASIMDIAPTVLHLLGVPVSADMDGHVLVDAYAPDFRRAHPVEEVRHERGSKENDLLHEPTAAEDERVKERLRGLGYIE